MRKIAIVGTQHKDGLDFYKKNGFEVLEITNFSKQNMIKNLKHVDGIALRTSELDKEILSECENLKIVARHGVGYDNVDLNYLNQKKIALAVTGTSNAASVAEHVMTMFLYLAKRIEDSNQLTKNGNFINKATLPDFFELYKKNIFILGYGRIGRALSKRCLGFETEIYVYDPFVDKKTIEDNECHKVDFLEGLHLADYISIHLPLSEETKNLITKNEFEIMKNNCILVNTARGGIVNENDLLWALKNNKIYGAGLDVFQKEPPEKNNPLFLCNNIVVTPHNAALTLECRKRMALETAENIVYFLNDKSNINAQNIVNRKNLDL